MGFCGIARERNLARRALNRARLIPIAILRISERTRLRMNEHYRDTQHEDAQRMLAKVAVKVLPRENWPEGLAECEEELRAEIAADEEKKRAAAERAAQRPALPPQPRRAIDPDVVRAELMLLSETEPEMLLRGLLLECREMVRGTAAIVADPAYYGCHDDYFHRLRGAAEVGTKLADSIVRLRGGTQLDERRQRIVVERVERVSSPTAPGEGGRASAEKRITR